MTSVPRLLTSLDAARFLGVSRTYVLHLASSGQLKATRVSSGYYLFAEPDIRRFQAERIRKAERDPRIRLRPSGEKE